MLLPSPPLSLGIPCAPGWNPDQEFRSQGFGGGGVGTMVGTTQLILMEVLILVFILSLKTLPSFVSSLHPRGFIPKPPKPRCPGGIYHSGAGISLLKRGFSRGSWEGGGISAHPGTSQLSGTKEMPQGKFRCRNSSKNSWVLLEIVKEFSMIS